MKSINTNILALVLLVLGATAMTSPVHAGEQTGSITQIILRETDGLIYFFMTGTPTAKPPCATYAGWSIPNENSESGKKLYAALLAARATNQEIRVQGKNTCTRWNDQEDVAAIIL